MSDINPNCDGAHCIKASSEVRKYPLGTNGQLHGNLILCRACAAHENRYRYMRSHTTGPDLPQVNWFKCEVYPS